MDPCASMAANSELIKEHFSGETLSSNRAHPIHSRENTLLEIPSQGKHCKPKQVSLYCILRNSLSLRDKLRQNICIVLLKVGKYVGEIVSVVSPDIQH